MTRNSGNPMFNVGDKVVYPMHGAGVIKAIEEKEILGESHRYYIMFLPIGDMKVMIPVDGIDVGLRPVIDTDDIESVLDVLKAGTTRMSTNWNRRYRANTEKLKTGDIYEVAEVVRNLTLRHEEKGLSTGERKMLDNSRQILISELVLILDSSPDDVETLVDNALSRGQEADAETGG